MELVERKSNQIVSKPINGRGLENADMEGVSFPRVIMMQPTSPQLADYENLRAGDLANNLTFEKLPKNFIPIKVWDSNILFSPREDKPEAKARLEHYGVTPDEMQASSILCNARDGKFGDKFGACSACSLCKFNDATGEKPLCNATINVLALFEGIPMPVLVQFAVTSHKHGRTFKQMMMFAGGDIFKNKYSLVTMKKQATGKMWFEMKAIPAGKCSSEEYEMAEAMWQMTQVDESYMEQANGAAEEFHPLETHSDDIPF